jgi:mycothione reductase
LRRGRVSSGYRHGVPHFDLAVIGSGSGNTIATKEFLDWSIAIIEDSTFGGTCLNVGCIPTKMYVYPADLAEAVRYGERLGIDAHVDGVRWSDMRDRIFGRIDAISSGGRDYRRHGNPNITLYESHASFVDGHTLELSTGETITADRIVIATGSRPAIPAVVMASGVRYETSDTVMRIDDVPSRVAILGGECTAAAAPRPADRRGVHRTGQAAVGRPARCAGQLAGDLG